MAIPHAQPGQAVDVSPLGPGLRSAQTLAIFKTAQLEVMRLVLPAGKSLPLHKVAGDITVQCIEGKIDVTYDATSHVLGAGQLLYVSARVSHGVVALEDASALVTIVLAR